MRSLGPIVFILFVFASAFAHAAEPKAGTYRVVFNLYTKVEALITLTPAANGQFTVSGKIWPEDAAKRRKDNTFTISGTLFKTGKLRAKTKRTGKDGSALDGNWDEAAGVLVITKYGSKDVKWLMEPLKPDSKPTPPTEASGFMAGIWNGGSQWGTVTITGGPTKYEGTYLMGHEGKFTVGPGQTGDLVGKWHGKPGHEGTMTISSMKQSKAFNAKIANVSWKCNKNCDDFCSKQGTGTWIEKKP